MMDYEELLYDLIENPKTCPLDNTGTVDLKRLRIQLLKVFPGKYHLDWVDKPLQAFDAIHMYRIKVIFHSDDEHTEWMLSNG